MDSVLPLRWMMSFKPLLSVNVENSMSERGRKFLFLFFLLFEQEVSLLQVIQVLLYREEDAENVCRLNQLANLAEELRARVEVNAVMSFFLCEGALLGDGGAEDNWGTRFFVCVCEKSEKLFLVPISVRLVDLHPAVFPSTFRTWSDEYPIAWPEAA